MSPSRRRVLAFMALVAISSVSILISAQENSSKWGFSGRLRQEPWIPCTISATTISQRIRERESVAQRCAADLFALFGGDSTACSVEQSRAKQLLDCVRVLAPDSAFRPPHYYYPQSEELNVVGVQAGVGYGDEYWREHRDFRKMIESPPAAVEELARKTVEWGGDSNVILNALSPMKYPVPEVEGSSKEHCTLTKYDDGRRFAETDITKYMAFLFEAIAKLSPSVGLNISLNRYDLFHGHMFTAHHTGRLGILFHSREYPAYNEEKFPLNLGFCQRGSTLPYDASMALRNIVWLAPMPDCSPAMDISSHTCSRKWLASGSLFVLDTSGGKILDRELVPDYLDVVHTVSEDDLGDVMLDVNYFNLVNETLEGHIFLC